MDLNNKRFIVGDSRGQLRVFNCLSGELMKTLSDHEDSEILNVMAVHTKEMNMIVSVGSNNLIKVHEDDKAHGASAVRRTIRVSNYEVQLAKLYIYEGRFGRS